MLKNIDRILPIHSELINWYRENKRDLPWRKTTDPYKIWLSEIILQQTRVAQGLAYYQKFSQHYPTVYDLAKATEDQVMKDWQGLGYYSRARNLRAAAKSIVNQHQGVFPKEYAEIKALKGVGDYTAAAIASFAFDQAYPVLDGNVYRFISRLYGIETPINTPKAKKEFLAITKASMPNDQAAEFNQAIMEFGALLCTPKQPKCHQCPFQNICYANEKVLQASFPVKKKAAKQKHRYFNYLIIQSNSDLILKKRTQNDIWQQLYDFPLVETKKQISGKGLMAHEDFQELMKGLPYTVESRSEEFKHILSHQVIHARFYHLKLNQLEDLGSADTEVVKRKHLAQYPIPKLLENYLRQETNFLSLSS